MRRRRRLALLVAVASLAALAAQATLVRGAEPVALEAIAQDDGSWRLEATVTDAEGDPRSRVSVTFTAAVDFFGDRWVPIGTAVTDTGGTAAIVYQPTWNGQQTLVARASGDDGPVASESIGIHVTGAPPGIPSEPADLPIVRAWALPVGVAAVVSVWIVLAFLFLTAVLGIARGTEATPTRSNPRTEGMQTVESPLDGGSST